MTTSSEHFCVQSRQSTKEEGEDDDKQEEEDQGTGQHANWTPGSQPSTIVSIFLFLALH